MWHYVVFIFHAEIIWSFEGYNFIIVSRSAIFTLDLLNGRAVSVHLLPGNGACALWARIIWAVCKCGCVDLCVCVCAETSSHQIVLAISFESRKRFCNSFSFIQPYIVRVCVCAGFWAQTHRHTGAHNDTIRWSAPHMIYLAKSECKAMRKLTNAIEHRPWCKRYGAAGRFYCSPWFPYRLTRRYCVARWCGDFPRNDERNMNRFIKLILPLCFRAKQYHTHRHTHTSI